MHIYYNCNKEAVIKSSHAVEIRSYISEYIHDHSLIDFSFQDCGKFIVSPKAPIVDVCREMIRHKYESAVVVENNIVIGIFTWIDALKAMGDLLQKKY